MKKLLITFLCLATLAVAQELPDNPQPQPKQKSEWQSQLTSRTWHETFTGKTFWFVHGLYLTTWVIDAEVTHQGLAHHKCTEANGNLPAYPSRGQLYRLNLIQFGAVTGIDLLLRKFGVPIAPYTTPLLMAGRHAYAAQEWSSCY